MGREIRRLARLLRGSRLPPGAPVAPPLPPGSAVDLPGRGETFVRHMAGAGPTVVLLHGWTATADVNWFRIYSSFDGCDVVALDQRGHGRGMRTSEKFRLEDCADDVAALLGVLDSGPAVLVGYSMGGPVALHVARRHPEAVTGLVLAATALEWHTDRLNRLRWRSMRPFEAVVRSRLGERITSRGVGQALAGVPEAERWERWLVAEFRRGDPRALADAGRALGRFDARLWAADAVRAPARVIVTARDEMVHPDRQRELAETLGVSALELEVGHDAPLRQGPELGCALRHAVDDVIRETRSSGRPVARGSAGPRSTPPTARL